MDGRTPGVESSSELTVLQSAFVLHRRAYSNSSLLLELLTPGQGRFPAIMRGVRGGRRQDTALLQPFRPLQVRVGGRGEVKGLFHYEADGELRPLVGTSLYCGFYLNELVLRLVGRDDPLPLLFRAYHESLVLLAAGEGQEPVLRRFEVALLQELGYGPELERELHSGAPIDPAGYYRYRLEQGPEAVAAATPDAVCGETLLALAGRRPLQGAPLREARDLMRRVLRHYLGERPLKSRELFRGGTGG